MARRKLELPPRPSAEAWEATPPEVIRYVEALERMIIELHEAFERHREETEQALREAKRQAARFGRKKRRTKRKKPGRKGGHTRQQRAIRGPVDEELEAPLPEQCPCCSSERIEALGSYEQRQDDIISKPISRRFTVHEGRCLDCGHKVEGRHPKQTSTARGAAAHHLGPNVLAIAAEMHFGQGVPFDKIREHLATLGLDVEASSLVRAMSRIATRSEATFEALLDEVLSQEVLHIDETGWYVDGKRCWLWVLSGADATVYFVRETRGSCEVEDFLTDFLGVLVTDGAKAYDKLGKKLLRALCLLHLRRNVRDLALLQTGGAVCIPRALDAWLTDVIELVGRRREMERSEWRRESARLQKVFEATFVASRPTNPSNRRLIKRVVRWQDAILRCLRDERVPATNNHAERQVRPAVVLRKRGGYSRSQRGARTYEVITSLLVTARQKGVEFVTWLVALLRQPQPHAAAPFW